jgi:hypothetical protein
MSGDHDSILKIDGHREHLELGLLLHFGHEPKFYRVVCENQPKQRTVHS